MKLFQRITPLLLAALLAPATSLAQCDKQQLLRGTLGDAYECFFENQPKILELREKEKATVMDANVPVTAPDPFAGKIHANYQDFLNLLSFAINQVEESKDGQALIVRFNPLRGGQNLVGTTLTIGKPALNSDLVESIPADKRPAVSAELEKQLKDTDDLLWAVSYSRQSKQCGTERLARSACWGRSPRVYRQALSKVLAEVSREEESSESSDSTRQQLFVDIVAAIPGLAGDLFKVPFTQVSPDQQDLVLDKLREAAARDARETEQSMPFFQESGIGNVATLIDNQPQFALTGTYRDLGHLSGGDEVAASLELQRGRTNLNTVFRECQASASCIAGKLKEFNDAAGSTLPTDKFVLTASYKKRGRFQVPNLDLPPELLSFEGLDLERSTELKVHLQWGRQISGNLRGLSGPQPEGASPKKARWDLSLDGLRNTKGTMRTQNRWVASWTLALPLAEQVSFPVTLTWANKPEFLTDQRKQYGVHFGLSYRLPWEGRAR
jgi:hypothetical protein